MAFNVPSFNRRLFSFGPAIVRIGAVGTTPLTDVGGVRDPMYTVTREQLQVTQGSPEVVVEQWTVKEDLRIEFRGIEWNFARMAECLGAGEVTTVGLTSTMDFGGDPATRSFAMMLEHRQPDGSTITMSIWEVKGDATMSVTFGRETHEFPYAFNALSGASNFVGAITPVRGKLYRIQRHAA